MHVALSIQEPGDTLGPALPGGDLETFFPHFLGQLFQHPLTLESGGEEGESRGWVNTDGDQIRGGGGWDKGRGILTGKVGDQIKSGKRGLW